MKKLLGLIFAGLMSLVVYADDLPLTIQDLSGGEVNQYDSMLIPDNSVYEARNVYFDDDSMVKKRKGMSKLNTSAIGDSGSIYNQFEFKKSNGTNYHIVCSSQTLYYRASGASFTAFLASYSTGTSVANFEVFMDTLQFCNGSANLQYWDTSKVGTTTSTYQPKYLLAWQNRLWIAGDTDEPSKLRSCEWLDPTDWTVPTSNAVATDPVVFDINSQDGQKIMGIRKSPNGYLLILKEKSCWELGGVDRDDFSLRLVSPDLGCVDQGSFAYKEGKATWLSSEGFVEYNGNTIKIISKPIQTTVDSIKQLSVGRGSLTKNSPTEWAVFSSTSFVDITSTPGSLTNYFAVAGTATYFNNSQTWGGLVKMGTSKYLVFRDNSATDGIWCEVFQDGSLMSRTKIQAGNWGGNPDCSLPNPVYGLNSWVKVDSANKVHLVYLYKTTGDWMVKYATSTDGVAWSTETFGDLDYPAYIGATAASTFQLALDLDSNNIPHVTYRKKTGTYTSYIQYYYRDSTWTDGGTIGTSANNYEWHDMVVNSSDNMDLLGKNLHISTSHYYLVQTTTGTTADVGETETDTGIDGDSADIGNLAITSDDKLYAALNNMMITNETGSWVEKAISGTNAVVRIGADNAPRIAYESGEDIYYMKYNTTLATFGTPRLVYDSGVYSTHWISNWVDAYNNPSVAYNKDASSNHAETLLFTSSGTYISEIYDTSYNSGITFDVFTTQETDNDYNVKHYVRSNASSTTITTASWTEFTKNQVPSLSAARYMQYKCDISTDVVNSSIPQIDEINVSYHSTSGSNRLASLFYDDRIYNAVSVSSGTILDRIIVYDSNNKWTELTSGINCMNIYNFNGTPYFGSDNGYIYQMDIGTNDDSKAIDAYILTKSYALGAIYMKNMSKLFILADNSGNWNLNLSYYLDKSATANETFTIDLDQMSGLINYKVPLLKNTPFGTIQFKFYNGNADEPFDMYGVYGFYRMQPLR